MEVTEEERKLTPHNSALKAPYLPPPEVIHITLSEEKYPSNLRYIFIGDIHGCFDELEEMFQKLSVDLAVDVVILVGDLVNKGPKSLEVVQFARKHNLLSTRGNHDDYALLRLYDRRKLQKEGINPDDDAFLKNYSWTDNLTSEDEEYLLKLPYTISIPQINVTVVHAGLIPNLPMEKQHPGGMYRMRNILKYTSNGGTEKYLSSDIADVGEACGSHWPGPSLLLFGHDAVRNLQFYPFAYGLDSGCCYGGELTACVITKSGIIESEVKSEHLRPDCYISQVKAHRVYEIPSFRK